MARGRPRKAGKRHPNGKLKHEPRIFGGETYRCALDTTPRGAVAEVEASEYGAKDRDWLFGVMRELDAAGLRPWLDQLISRLYTDQGPPWLDRLITGVRCPADLSLISTANDALDVVAPHRQQAGYRTLHSTGET